MFTRITGDQKRYVENFLKNEIMDDCKMRFAKNNPNKYCKVDDALVHLGTFYEAMDTGNDTDTVQRLTHPVKRPCILKVKIEKSAIRQMSIKYSQRNPTKTLDDLVIFLTVYFQRDMTKYIDLIKEALCSSDKNKASI